MKNIQKAILLASILFGAAAANAATLIHDYQFNGNLNDSLGGAALVAEGGTLGSGSYQFGINQGLILTSGMMSADSYSIALNFNFSALGGWQKIIDFKNRSSDNGLYASGTNLSFYPFGTGTGHLSAQQNTLVVTRDSTSNLLTAYLNGVKSMSVTDLSRIAVFTGTDPIARFFRDDFGSQAGAGVVNSIKVWNGALTASEVAHINDVNALPLPGTLWLLGAALPGLGLLNKRKQA